MEKTRKRPHLVLHGLDHNIFFLREIIAERRKKTIVAFGRKSCGRAFLAFFPSRDKQ